MGLPNSTNSEKMATNRGLNDFSHSPSFCYFSVFFFCYQTGLPNSANSAKIKKNRGRNDFSHLTIMRYFFVVLTYQIGFPNSTNSRKVRKIVPFTIFPYVFIT